MKVCNSNGDCVNGVCKCVEGYHPDYYGCLIPICFGVDDLKDDVCSGRGYIF
jgi:hypothetical protein